MGACLCLYTGTASAGTISNWKNTGTDWNTAGNWSAGIPTGGTGNGNGAGFTTGAVTNPNLSSNATAGSLQFSTAASSGYTISANTGLSLTLDGGGTSATTSNWSVYAQNTSGTNTISAPLVLSSAGSLVQVAGGTLVLSGPLSGSLSTLTFSGTDAGGGGTFRITGTNNSITNSGSNLTRITGGATVQISSLGNTGANGSLGVGGTAGIALGSQSAILGVTGNKSGTLMYQGSGETSNRLITNTYNSTISTTGASGALVLSGVIFSTTSNAGNLILSGTDNGLTGASQNTGTLNNAIVNGGPSNNFANGITKTGSGTWILSNTGSSFTGPTTISGGILSVGGLANVNTNSSIGKGSSTASAADLVLDGGTLQYKGTIATSTNRPYTLTSNGGSLDASGTVAGTMTISGNLTDSATSGTQTLTLTGTGTSTTGGGTLSGTINNGTGSTVAVTKAGTGTWTLSGVNAFSGTTTINAGKLALVSTTSNNNIGSSNKILVGSGANLDVTGITASGGFQVQNGQTVAGSGTVVGNTNFLSGSTLSAGNSGVGTTTYSGNLILSSGTLLVFDLAAVGASDQVIVNGAGNKLTLNNQSISDFTFNTLTGFGPGTYILMDSSANGINGTLNGNPANLTEILGGYNATLSLNSGDVILTVAVVPEPSTYALLVSGVVTLLLISRRKNQSEKC